MAGMQTMETQGTRFFWSTSTALSTAQEVLGVKNWSGFGGTSPVIDVSDLKSTSREKRMGLRDAGELTLSGNYNASTAVSPGLAAMDADAGTRTLRKFALKWSTVDANGVGKEVNAYCGGVTIDGSEDDIVTFSAQVIFAGCASNTTFAT
jgi:hypothetical protein